MRLTQKDLQEKLEQQLRLIHSSIETFDKGLTDEAINLAIRLRVLLHDTTESESLLTQLQEKHTLSFYDSGFSEPQNTLITSFSKLTYIFSGSKGIRELPVLDEGPNNNSMVFDDRWNGIIFIDMEGKKFSRKDIVLYVANKDGGGHVSREPGKKYIKLTRENSLGRKVFVNGNRYGIKGTEYVAIRQIAHELLKSLDENYNCIHGDLGSGYFIGPMEVKFA